MKKLIVITVIFTIEFSFSYVYAQQSSYILAKVKVAEVSKVKDLSLDMVKRQKSSIWGQPEEWVEIVTDSVQLAKIKERGVAIEVLIQDMEKYYARKMSGKGANFGNFYTYSEAQAILDSLHANYPSITTALTSLGKSWENNDIWAMKISDNPTQQEAETEVYFDGVHHAREAITVNILVEFVRYLCENYGTDSTITDLVNNLQIWVVPIVNPDGYLYNENHNPTGGGMWRKNRRNNGGNVYGVDINRNYGYMWGYNDDGSSPDSSSASYRGPSAFSEPETQAIRDFIKQHQFVAGISYHSYAGLLLFPWSYDTAYTSDDLLFRRMGCEMTYDNHYIYGIPPDVLYSCNGTSMDWLYGDTTKPKILNFSPEVNSEGFWDEDAISRNIQECQPMNLYLLKFARGSVGSGPYVIYKNHTINDSLGNNDGIIDQNEQINVITWVRNFGDSTAYGASGMLTTNDPYVTIQDSFEYFGNIGIGDSAVGQYRFILASNCPNGRLIDFNIVCKDTNNLSWISKISIKTGIEWANHDTGNVVFTVTCKGICGYINPGVEGSGFIYPKSGDNQLYVGSLWIGNSGIWIANRDYNSDPAREWETTLSPNGKITISGNKFSDQDGWAMYEDTVKKIRVEQNSWAWAGDPYQDFVVIRYIINNDADTSVNGIYAGQFMDFDLWGGSRNNGGSDSTRRLAYMWGNYNWPYVGVKILDPKSSKNLSFIRNSTYVIPNGYILDSNKFKFLNGTTSVRNASDTTDWSLISSAGPFNIQPEDSIVFAIAVIGGDSLSDIKRNADSAQACYDRAVAVEEINPLSKVILFQNIPNPFIRSTLISYQIPAKSKVSLKIYDLTGRQVTKLVDEEQVAGIYHIRWDVTKNPAGIYFYRLEFNKATLTKKLVIL